MTDPQGRPYFLWDADLTLAQFESTLQHENPEVRAYFIGKLMRQARPDDVFQFVSLETIQDLQARIDPYLGRSRPFWTWLLDAWARQADGAR